MGRNVPRGSLCFIDIIFSLIIGLGCIFSVRILRWFLSNTLRENISNLLLQPQFGLVKTVVASASHCSSEKAGTDIGTGILTMSHVRGNRSGVQRRPQGWRAECRGDPEAGGQSVPSGERFGRREDDTGIVGF